MPTSIMLHRRRDIAQIEQEENILVVQLIFCLVDSTKINILLGLDTSSQWVDFSKVRHGLETMATHFENIAFPEEAELWVPKKCAINQV